MNTLFHIEGHLLYALRNATVKKWPFPHFYVENCFPDDFYRSLTEKLAEKDDFKGVEGRYSGRTFARAEDISELDFMNTQEFMQQVAKVFHPYMKAHFGDTEAKIFHDLRLIRDGKNYSIGPHTDANWKLVSLLFYLPATDEHSYAGTSIYLPKDRSLTCPGGPHHQFKDFDLIATAPYKPNTCFGFFKTAQSFHGVEQLPEAFKRDLLLYNLYDHAIYLQTHKPAKEQSP